MPDQDWVPPPPPKTLPFDDNEFNRPAARNLGHLVEDYEAAVRVLKARRDSGDLPDVMYYEACARERESLVHRVLHEYENACAVGSGFYENLTYTILRTRINVQDGVRRALTRLENDVRDVNNAHGDVEVADLDVSAFESVIASMNEIWTMKMLLTGFGLETEAPAILADIAAKKFGPSTRTVSMPVKGNR